MGVILSEAGKKVVNFTQQSCGDCREFTKKGTSFRIIVGNWPIALNLVCVFYSQGNIVKSD